jgi:hypothetical protein
LKDGKRGQAFHLLDQSGWDLEYDEISALTRGSNMLRRDIGLAMAKVLAAAGIKSELTAV